MNDTLEKREKLYLCPLCASSNIYLSHIPDIYGCRECQVKFRNPRPYEEKVIDCYDKGETFKQWQSELGIRSHLWKKRLSLVVSYRKSGSLLDIGTGDGYFLKFASELFDIDATEVSKSGVSYARGHGFSVHHGTIWGPEFNDRKYDIITMWHVLEHLSEPNKALVRIKEMLKPGGYLFIAVPNELMSLYTFGLLFKKNSPFGDLKCNEEIHLTHYTPRQLAEALESIYGFDVISVRVDDVHTRNRKIRIPVMYFNNMISALFGVHSDRAMVIVCRAGNI